MPTNLTLKNIPDEVYSRLKASAQLHRRSLNREAIVCLEAVLLASHGGAEERLARLRPLRATLPRDQFNVNDIEVMKQEGRP